MLQEFKDKVSRKILPRMVSNALNIVKVKFKPSFIDELKNKYQSNYRNSPVAISIRHLSCMGNPNYFNCHSNILSACTDGIVW